MPSKTVKAASSAPVRRSRTGCLTCRRRKLKCDEATPICGQCQKSRRQCDRSEGVTFRHHQNAAIDRDEQDHSLGSFFKYSQSYSAENIRSFLPVPQTLTWIQVSDPNSEDSNAVTPPPQEPATSDPYQQVAAHTLEALSTAAADHVSYPPQATAYYTAMGSQSAPHPEYGFVRLENDDGTREGSSNNANYMNAQGQNTSLMIDPNLETTVADPAEQAVSMEESADHTGAQDGHENDGHDSHIEGDGMGDSESRVAMALRTFNEA
ncbi:hypothetical protein LTS15_007939 [Exophiala xenobiotica]|nr:hypothetical protein LTS15_007939 [Exophiala xenobiotica]